MNAQFFIDHVSEVLPPKKPLNTTQEHAMRQHLERFTEAEMDSLCRAVFESCKYFPTIADLTEAAKMAGIQYSRLNDTRAHVWEPTDCPRCGGSGLVAVWWAQAFSFDEAGRKWWDRTLHYLQPYHQSGEYGRRKDHDDVRTVYRCDCSSGAAETLPRGVPLWNRETPTTVRRAM